MDRSPGIRGRRSIEEVIHGKIMMDQSEFAADVENRVANLERRGGGLAIYHIEVFENTKAVVTGNDQFNWEIPEDLDGAKLLKVDAYVNTASSSGSVQVQIHKMSNEGTQSAGDVLSTPITIEVGQLNAKLAAAQPVVDGTNDDVVWGDHYRIDVDTAGVGTLGLGLIVYFIGAPNKITIVEGSKGEPGGVTQWKGAFNVSITYLTHQAVYYAGTSYVAVQDVPAGITPGVTGGWENYWMVLAQGHQFTALTTQINGQGYVLDAGLKAIIRVPFACNIVEWSVLADQQGTIVFDIWKDTYTNYPPTNADSIVASDPPQLNASSKATSTALTGWTTSIAAGDALHIVVEGTPAFVRFCSLTLKMARI